MQLREKIIKCLEKYPDTSNSDIKLTSTVWYEFHNHKLSRDSDGDLTVKLKNLYDLPTQESVKRERAKLNEKGLYLPTSPKVLKQRRLLEKQYRLKYSPSNPSRG